MLADTHCHIDLPAFDPDRPAVLARAAQAGVGRILVPALNVESSRRVVDLAAGQALLFAAVGVHPTEAKSWSAVAGRDLRRLARSRKVVAIGEVGLDYYWEAAPHAEQAEVLRRQLEIAGETGLPVVLHFREQHDAEDGACAADLLRILEWWTAGLQPAGRPRGVLHSFSGTTATASTAVSLGFYIGVTGPITYKSAARRREAIASVPPARILLETDAPYLAPSPHRGQRNEPAFIKHIADRIAEMFGMTRTRLEEITSQNANSLFHWGISQ